MAKLQLDYLKPQSARQYDFYLVPKLLIDHEAFDSVDYGAKLLYSLMLNRASLSALNAQDFTDEHGHLFIIYTVEQVMDHLRCSTKTAVKMLKQLDDVGLIEKKRQGQGKPSIIYIKDFATVQFLNCKKYNSRIVKSTTLEFQKVQSSNNESSNNDINKNLSIYPSYLNTPIADFGSHSENVENRLIDKIDNDTYTQYLEIVKNNIAYEHLLNGEFKYSPKALEEIITIIVDTLCSTKDHIRVNGEDKPAAIVQSQLLKLNSEHIEYVNHCMEKNTTKINNIRAYLLSALYNAPSSMDNYWRAKVNHDLYGSKEEY